MFCIDFGQGVRIVSHYEQAQVDGITFEPFPGMELVSNNMAIGLESEELSVRIIHDEEIFSQGSILSGGYSHSKVWLYWYEDDGTIVKRAAYIAGVEVKEMESIFHFNNLTSFLEEEVCERYSMRCRAKFGDTRCGVDKSAYSSYATIKQIIGLYSVELQSMQVEPALFKDGSVQFIGVSPITTFGISHFEGFTMVLASALTVAPQSGQQCILYYGCNKYAQTCKERYNNIINFRGEPFILDDSNGK